jgi:hypothetical protein
MDDGVNSEPMVDDGADWEYIGNVDRSNIYLTRQGSVVIQCRGQRTVLSKKIAQKIVEEVQWD